MIKHKSEFSERLQTLIGEDNVSSFARKCNVGVTTLRKYLDESLPRLDKLLAIRDATGVNIEWLATGQGPMYPVKNNGTNGSLQAFGDPLIKELQLWLRDMTTEEPEWRAWFEIELARKIPEFAEWRKKNREDTSHQQSAAS